MTGGTERLLVSLAGQLGTSRAILRHLTSYTAHKSLSFCTAAHCTCGLADLLAQVRELLDREDPTAADAVLLEAERARVVSILERYNPDALDPLHLARLREAVLSGRGTAA